MMFTNLLVLGLLLVTFGNYSHLCFAISHNHFYNYFAATGQVVNSTQAAVKVDQSASTTATPELKFNSSMEKTQLINECIDLIQNRWSEDGSMVVVATQTFGGCGGCGGCC